MIKKILIRWFVIVYKMSEKSMSPFPDVSTIIVTFNGVFTFYLIFNYILCLDSYLSLIWFFIISITISILSVLYFYYKNRNEILKKSINYQLKFYEVIVCLLQIFVSSIIIANIIKNLGDRNGIELL